MIEMIDVIATPDDGKKRYSNSIHHILYVLYIQYNIMIYDELKHIKNFTFLIPVS